MSTTGQYTDTVERSKFKPRENYLMEEDTEGHVQHYIEQAKQMGSKAVDKGSEIVKKNPGYSVLSAAAVGFILGAYVSRRR